jgi:DNA/RNA endonuclease G (NUC1)
MDINLVPQLGKLNIGEFRILERRVRDLAKQRLSSLYFVRPIYSKISQTPAMFEQGAILAPRSLLYARHKNS